MPTPRIYIDTSVIGGCLDEEFQPWSEGLMALFCRGEAVAIVSDVTLQELMQAPKAVRELFEQLPKQSVNEVDYDDEAADLAEAYIAAGVVGRASFADAQHVAIAALHRATVLVSWNFRHIVNLNRIHAFNAVNLRRGYPQLEIRSPREVLDDDEGGQDV